MKVKFVPKHRGTARHTLAADDQIEQRVGMAWHGGGAGGSTLVISLDFKYEPFELLTTDYLRTSPGWQLSSCSPTGGGDAGNG